MLGSSPAGITEWPLGLKVRTAASQAANVEFKGYLYHYDAQVLNSMMESFVSWEDRPMACSMDICVTKDGRTLLVEFKSTNRDCDSGWKKITEVQRDGTNVFVNPAKGDREAN